MQNVMCERDSFLSYLNHCHFGCLFLVMETICNQLRGLGPAWAGSVHSKYTRQDENVGDSKESLYYG